MPSRTISIDGTRWNAFPSGFVTQYDRDEFGVLFVRAVGDTTGGTAGGTVGRPAREVRVVRYSPHGSRFREAAFAELTEQRLVELFWQSQPGDTSPEAGYTR